MNETTFKQFRRNIRQHEGCPLFRNKCTCPREEVANAYECSDQRAVTVAAQFSSFHRCDWGIGVWFYDRFLSCNFTWLLMPHKTLPVFSNLCVLIVISREAAIHLCIDWFVVLLLLYLGLGLALPDSEQWESLMSWALWWDCCRCLGRLLQDHNYN